MIPLCVPNLAGNERRYLDECIDTTFVSTVGPFVSRFETMVAEAAVAPAAVATSAGTTGLHLALLAAGVRPGDLVVLPSFTFIASANAIAHCGAGPWLFDVDPTSWTLDPAQVETALSQECRSSGGELVHGPSGRRVAAILAVYTLGTAPDMDRLAAIAARFNLPLVGDAAAALGCRYRGRPVGDHGTLLSVFSFNGNKTVTAGGGGAVIGDADRLALVRHLSSTARVGSDYTHDRVGFNYRMTNLQAAVGCAQMELLDRFVAAKRAIRERYRTAFADLPGLSPFPEPDWSESACWFSGLVLPEGGLSPDALRQRLSAAGIEARPFWKPMHLQPPFADAPRTDQSVTDRVWHRIVTLPCSTQLTAADQDHVIAVVREALS
ncbi:MAG: aminotransferase class I/II-fold pyridoxal phosphate-dependent enzyme [Alphaproteobacteria bacterium]|nr:aminotransferase class I/II-fold pyridoxal phosphate-dependent enzyme [Alphaproteobacteria bacterium]